MRRAPRLSVELAGRTQNSCCIRVVRLAIYSKGSVLNRLLQLAVVFMMSVALLSFGMPQDSQEALGPKDNPSQKNARHPLSELMATKTSQLRPELVGKHPRVFFTDSELAELRQHAQTTHRELWQEALKPSAAAAGRSKARTEYGWAGDCGVRVCV